MIEETPLCERCNRPFKPAEEDGNRCRACFDVNYAIVESPNLDGIQKPSGIPEPEDE